MGVWDVFFLINVLNPYACSHLMMATTIFLVRLHKPLIQSLRSNSFGPVLGSDLSCQVAVVLKGYGVTGVCVVYAVIVICLCVHLYVSLIPNFFLYWCITNQELLSCSAVHSEI